MEDKRDTQLKSTHLWWTITICSSLLQGVVTSCQAVDLYSWETSSRLGRALQPQSFSSPSVRLLGKHQFLGVPSFNGLIAKGRGTVSLFALARMVSAGVVLLLPQLQSYCKSPYSCLVGAGLLKFPSFSALCIPAPKGGLFPTFQPASAIECYSLFLSVHQPGLNGDGMSASVLGRLLVPE